MFSLWKFAFYNYKNPYDTVVYSYSNKNLRDKDIKIILLQTYLVAIFSYKCILSVYYNKYIFEMYSETWCSEGILIDLMKRISKIRNV